MKALTEEGGEVGIESGKADLASVEKNTTKKKVRIVKKIVKKKVIRKVPKRAPVASHNNDIEKVASPNPNDNPHMETEEAPVVVEIEKPNLVVNDSREVKVSNKDNDVCLVGTSDGCRDESERSGLVSASSLSDQNQIELLDSAPSINTMDVEEHEGEDDMKEQDEKIFKTNLEVNEDTEVAKSVKEQAESNECDDAKLEGGLSNDVKREENTKKQVDLKQSDPFKLEDEVNTGELVSSRLHMKHMSKIFIHGLGTETKEEDIRKVFENVGKVIEVKLIRNHRSGKRRGCGFIRYASPDLAKLALKKYNNVEICGKVCHTAAVEGTDTIILNNIDKNWNNEHVLKLLQKNGIRNIDEVSVVPDPKNPKLNRGFAYLELVTKKDAQIVYNRLQNKKIFGNYSKIKVTWAPPLTDDLVEEEISNNNNNCYGNNDNSKSVYAVNIPSKWEEKEVRDHFGRFGEIKSIALAKNLRSTYRNDFAFVNYTTCESALSCVEELTCGKSTDGKGIKVSLAKSIPKVKPVKIMSGSNVGDVKEKGFNLRPHKPQNMKNYGGRKGECSSTTDELVRLLREQASWKHGGPSLTQGVNSGHHHEPPFGGKQEFTQMGSKLLYDDSQAYHQTHLQIPNAAIHRPTGNGVAMSSFHHFDPQHERVHYTSGSLNPGYFQTRDHQPSYHGSSSSSSSIYPHMR
ncbi:hypothetical protein LXL04_032779 [Taraxacum kok-saghyz]